MNFLHRMAFWRLTKTGLGLLFYFCLAQTFIIEAAMKYYHFFKQIHNLQGLNFYLDNFD